MPAYVNKYMDFYAVVYNAISETTQNYNYHNWKWNISIIIFVVKQRENVRKLTIQKEEKRMHSLHLLYEYNHVYCVLYSV